MTAPLTDARVAEIAKEIKQTLWRSGDIFDGFAHDPVVDTGCRNNGLDLRAFVSRTRAAAEVVDVLLTALAQCREERERGCPCLHTTPCQPDCTCVQPFSSAGCRRCCSYGSKEQQRAKAESLVAATAALAAAKEDTLAATLDADHWRGSAEAAKTLLDEAEAALAAAREAGQSMYDILANEQCFCGPTVKCRRCKALDKWDVAQAPGQREEGT